MVEFKNGMIIETRNGSLYVYVENFVSNAVWAGKKIFVRISDNNVGYLPYINYNKNDLTDKDRIREFDIMKVWIPASPCDFTSKDRLINKKNWELIWERTEKEELPIGDVLDILNDTCEFEITYEDGKFWRFV